MVHMTADMDDAGGVEEGESDAERTKERLGKPTGRVKGKIGEPGRLF
jgi:hypothetical protein